MSLNDILNAVTGNQFELAASLISDVWNRLGAAATIYGIIRSGSVPVLAVFRAQKLCSERDLVVLCSNAFHELQIKQVCITYDMNLYLLRLFASYGLYNFCGSVDVRRLDSVTGSWVDSIGLVKKWTYELRTRERWYDYLDFDNEVEFQLRMIHNELFFIKDRKELKEVPLKEVLFCVAVFVKSMNDCPGDFLYRTIINQRNLIQFLVVVCGVMKRIQKNEKCCIRRHMLKKLNKVYRKLKQIRSIMKLVQNVPAKLNEFTERDYDRSNAHVTVAAMKRFIQVFGEAIKNTSDSPNFPTKLNKMLPILFKDSLWLNSKYRDWSSHGYPLSTLYMREPDQIFYYRHMKQYMMLIAISSLVFTVYIFLDCTQNLFGLMRRTTSMDDMRALIRYAGNNKLHANQKVLFRNIFRFLEYCLYQLESGYESNDQSFKETKESYLRKQVLVEDLNVVHREVEQYMNMIEIATFAKSSLQSIHALVDLKLQTFLSKDAFRRIISQWQTGKTMESDYYSRTAISMQRYIHQNIELHQINPEQEIYHEETDKIFSHFSSELKEESEKLKSELNESLVNGYYQNIFGIDQKAQAITNILKSHFTGTKDSERFKARNREFKSILDKIRRSDEILLENEFRRVIQFIRNVFIENNCRTFESFCENFRTIPLKHRLALEYWQMQAMEILMKTKYFGDNFGTLKRSLPMIWGKTYRNYLAHDCLSYDLLTVSDASRIFVNGYVLAFDSDELKIFSRACNFDLEGFARLEDKGFEWITIQTNLLNAYRQQNESTVNDFLQMNADTWGRFYCAPGKFLKHRLCSIAEVLSHDAPDMELINPVVVKLSLSDPAYSPFIFQAEINTNLLVNLEQFDYLDIAEAIDQFRELQPELVTPCIGGALKYLVKNGNFATLRTLLKDYGDFADKIIHIVTSYSTSVVMECAHIYEMTNSQLEDFFVNQICNLQNWLLIVRSNHLEALRLALRLHEGTLASSTVSKVVSACCIAGRLEMVKVLLSYGVPPESIQLITALNHHRWNIIEHLVNNGIDPWQDDGLLVFALVIEQNFKLVRQIIKTSFPSKFHHDILRCVAKNGSQPLFEFVINRVDNMWECTDVLESALMNTEPKVVNFLLRMLFSSTDATSSDPVLGEWINVLSELRVLEFLKSTSAIILTAITSNLEAAELITKKVLDFSCVNKSATVWVDEQNHGQRSNSSDIIGSCSSMLKEMLSLPNSLYTETKRTTQVHRNSKLEVSVEFTLYTKKATADTCNKCQDFGAFDINDLMTSLAAFLRRTSDPSVHCLSIVTGTLIIRNGTQLQNHFRFCSTKSAHCVLDDIESHLAPPDGLLNTDTFSAVHNFPSTASSIFLQNILDLGADPLRMGNTKRTAFHVILLENHLLEHLELIYQHCVKSSRTHFPNGVHVFNFADIDGYTPLGYAVRTRNLKAVEYMLRNGADPCVASLESEAGILHDAILNRSGKMILLLLNHSPQLIYKPVNDENKESALEKAVKINNYRLTQLFLKHGADLGHRNRLGMTAVGIAIEHCSMESLRILLEFAERIGEPITDFVTGDGQSALEYAKTLQDPDLIKILEDHVNKNER